MNSLECLEFNPRLFVFGDQSIILGADKHINNWIQTTIMIGRQIVVKVGKLKGCLQRKSGQQGWLEELLLKRFHIKEWENLTCVLKNEADT